MNWAAESNGLRLVNATAEETRRLGGALEELSESRKDSDPRRRLVNPLSREVVEGHLTRKTIEHLSKWCHLWSERSKFGKSVEPACEVSRLLFGDAPLPRMRDNQNRRIEGADQLWATFVQAVAERQGQHEPA